MANAVLYSQLLHHFAQDEDGSWYLKDEIVDWCDENGIQLEEATFHVGSSRQYGLFFDLDEDFMAFRLRWL